jgi:translocation and assembly module TamA
MQSKFIYGLRGFGRLILRCEGGAGLVDDFSEMPVSLRFFAGGDQSVRGYGYKTLGPIDEDGKVIGGRHLLIMSIEYEQRLTERWGVALFYDIGNAINTPSDPLKEGAGLGIRWRSPVGSIRLDMASPLATLDTPHPLWRLHLSIGPDL